MKRRNYNTGGNIMSIASNLVSSKNEEGKFQPFGDNAGAGALKGAQMGMTFGPWGALVGGAVGGIAGGVTQIANSGPQFAKAQPMQKADPFANVSLGDGGRLHKSKQGSELDPLNGFVFSNKTGVAPELKKNLSKLNLPKDFLIKFKGEKHSGPNGGIPIDRTFNPVLKEHKTNLSTTPVGEAIANVEEGEVMINPIHLSGTSLDDITANTARRMSEEAIVKNEKNKVTSGTNLKKMADGGFIEGEILPNNYFDLPSIDTSKFVNNNLLGTDPRLIGADVSANANQLLNPASNTVTPNTIKPIGKPFVNTPDGGSPPSINELVGRSSLFSQPVPESTLSTPKGSNSFNRIGEELRTNNFTKGDELQAASTLVPGLFNIGRALIDRPEKVKPALNMQQNNALNLLGQRSSNLTAARNDARLAANAQINRNSNARSFGVRNALNQQTTSNLQRNLAQVGLQEQNLRNALLSSEAQTRLQIGADNRNAMEAARKETNLNKSARVNQLTEGVTQLSNAGVRIGQMENDALNNKRTFQLLQNQYPDFTLADYDKYLSAGLTGEQIIRYRQMNLIK